MEVDQKPFEMAIAKPIAPDSTQSAPVASFPGPGDTGRFFALGRFLISLIFIASGFMKLLNFQETLNSLSAMGLPANEMLLGIATAIELIGGFSLLTGYGSPFAAWILAIYLIPVSLIFHSDFSDQQQVLHFLKNLAIIGGLLEVGEIGRMVHALRRSKRELTPRKPDRSAA